MVETVDTQKLANVLNKEFGKVRKEAPMKVLV